MAARFLVGFGARDVQPRGAVGFCGQVLPLKGRGFAAAQEAIAHRAYERDIHVASPGGGLGRLHADKTQLFEFVEGGMSKHGSQGLRLGRLAVIGGTPDIVMHNTGIERLGQWPALETVLQDRRHVVVPVSSKFQGPVAGGLEALRPVFAPQIEYAQDGPEALLRMGTALHDLGRQSVGGRAYLLSPHRSPRS